MPVPAQAAAPAPAPSRRNLLLALSGGAVVVVGGGAVAMAGLGGSSGTTTAAASNPATSSVGAAPSTAVSTAASPAAPGGAAPTSAALPSGAGQQHPLPPTGALPPPNGAAGALQGPAAAPFWELDGVGRVTSMASGEGMLVVLGDSGVSGYDLGGNPKWGPVPASGVPGSGNGVVASGVVYLVVASGAGGDLLALDVKTGAQKWRTPMPVPSATGARIGGVLTGAVFVVGIAGALPFLWSVDAGSGAQRWMKSGVQFTTLAVPTDGTQVVVAGAPGPDAAGTIAGVDVGNGDQVWARPLKTSVDYSRVSVSMAASAGEVYVSLLVDAQNPGTLVGGAASSGQDKWNASLPEAPGEAGTLALITCSSGSAAVVAVSHHGLYAVDLSSGRVLWQSQGADSFNTVSDAGAPQIADGIVYVYDDKGTWWAVDLASGRTRWQYAAAGFDGAADPVWVAVSGGLVLCTGGRLAMVAARG